MPRGLTCVAHKHTALAPIEIHHVWPTQYHGPDVPGNKVPVCANAHSDVHYLDATDATRLALINYNGCVRGRNTPDCKAYPDKVQRHVERSARSTCAGKGFRDCVALPLWAALRDTTDPLGGPTAEGIGL